MISIIYENKEILVINKPAGLAVQPGKGLTTSVIEILKKELPYEPFLVHRLDKETSGILLLAKNQIAANKFSGLIAKDAVEKTYFAICVGIPPKMKDTIRKPIIQGGIEKTAITHYQVLQTFNQQYSLLSLIIETGRMHQIRIHMSGIGCPIVGDDRYGNFQTNKWIKKEINIKKMLLHARQIIIPTNNVIKAELPEYFQLFFKFFNQELSF